MDLRGRVPSTMRYTLPAKNSFQIIPQNLFFADLRNLQSLNLFYGRRQIPFSREIRTPENSFSRKNLQNWGRSYFLLQKFITYRPLTLSFF